VAGEALYFEADRPDSGAGWWVVESPGTAPVTVDAPPQDNTPPHPAEAPWEAGAYAATDMRPVLESGWAEREGRVFFAGYTPDTGVELWTLEPASGDAALFADLLPGTASGNPVKFLLLNGRIFFTACDLNRGLEVWESDGTPGGTRVYADFLPTPRSSAPAHLTAMGSHLLFSYRIDEGPWRLARFDTDVNLDTARISYYLHYAGFSIEELAPVGGRIYLSAQHDAFGQELWCYEPDTERCWLVKDVLPNTAFDAVENAWRPISPLTE
jgi:ELWxxDGT repeat protein